MKSLKPWFWTENVAVMYSRNFIGAVRFEDEVWETAVEADAYPHCNDDVLEEDRVLDNVLVCIEFAFVCNGWSDDFCFACKTNPEASDREPNEDAQVTAVSTAAEEDCLACAQTWDEGANHVQDTSESQDHEDNPGPHHEGNVQRRIIDPCRLCCSIFLRYRSFGFTYVFSLAVCFVHSGCHP